MKRPRRPVVVATTSVVALSLAMALTVALAGGPPSPGSRTALAAAAAPAAAAGDTPAGFWYGTDSLPITISGTAPYQEPKIGGAYGGYIGMIGNWAIWQGCGGHLAWSAADSSAANTNFTTYGKGIGTGVYWFMAGPGIDPNYNGTRAEATTWGAKQAARTLSDIARQHITYPVVFMDIELPGIAPATDNGWNAVYTSPCSGKIKTGFIAAGPWD